MIKRCHDEQNPMYPDYGGRGILVEDYFRESLDKYINYVENLENYSLDLELDRIDNNRGYERGNLRWISSKQNKANTRRSIRVTYEDKEYCLSHFIQQNTNLSLSYATKLFRQGYSLQELADWK